MFGLLFSIVRSPATTELGHCSGTGATGEPEADRRHLRSEDEIALFKSVGAGIEDLAAGITVWERVAG
jgi:ornithine cyclodeaminase/alanine dehydrogenase-like protein (mu-crystallin family)